MTKFARKCSVCNEGMNTGFYIDGNYYCGIDCRNEKVSEAVYSDMHDDLDGEAYWTEWDNVHDAQYELVDGVLIEIDN